MSQEICLICKKDLTIEEQEYYTCKKCTKILKNKRPKPRTFTRLDSPMGKDIMDGKFNLKQ